ncbi:hypothetical protein PPERSA_01416 [Pseudocohnilembus persalinus]|uniref:RRM domain-containing protein n=1 Tax=Pseudocohnilembus persalinus TaxID=266149 RepID=A0A0V0QH22_PSEPJ|nr:hypothetical protein PPERSA_01416 [Pseudocohnilembus persalinus]|eukprot:KRX01513.1 hypothetical protein PPERSA_01416 [Pseudocohnilembus persalinus]
MSKVQQVDRNPEATVYVGNIDLKVTPEIIWELFSQCGVVVNVHLPKEKISSDHQGYGFVEFKTEEDADYSIKILHMIKLYGKPIKVNKASQDKKTQEVGANIFIGNLDPSVDEKKLYDTFQAFGLILSTRISRDTETGVSKGFGFVSFDNFESSDNAIRTMDNKFFQNKVIQVNYAYKKDSKGERHGSEAERFLAANRPSQAKGVYAAPFQQQVLPKEMAPQQTLHMPEQLIPNIPLPKFNTQNMMMPPPQMHQQQNNMMPFNMPPMPPQGGFPPMPFMGQHPLPPLPPNFQNLPKLPQPNLLPPPVAQQQNQQKQQQQPQQPQQQGAQQQLNQQQNQNQQQQIQQPPPISKN